MSALDTLYSIFKNANPNASDEDIKAHVDSLKASPEQISSALQPLTTSDMLMEEYGGKPTSPAPVSPQAISPAPEDQPAPSPAALKGNSDLSMNFPDVNAAKSDYGVNVSDNTATLNGKQEDTGNEAPSNYKMTSEAMQKPISDEFGSPTPAGQPDAAQTPPSAAPAKASSSAKPSNSTAALKSLISGSPTADTARADMLAKEKRKHNLGILPVAAAGIGDAIGSAASAFGAKGETGEQDKVVEGLNQSIDKDKENFELAQKRDPNSAVSKHYQKVLGLMLGDHAKDMDVSKMSAENIASTLPEVEKYMQKELGLKQIQSNKELQMAMHEEGRQDKLEKDGREWYDNLTKARNGELGVQNAKVDQARHLLQAFKQAEDTGKPFTNSTYREIAVGLANLMSNGGKTNSETEHAIAQATMKGDINKALTYAGMDPQTLGGTTESMMKTLKESILRQGMEAENQRNKFIEDHKNSMPSGLSPKQYDRLTSVDLGNSIKEFQPKQGAASSIPKASAPENTVKKIGNHSFTVINGQWHEILQ